MITTKQITTFTCDKCGAKKKYKSEDWQKNCFNAFMDGWISDEDTNVTCPNCNESSVCDDCPGCNKSSVCDDCAEQSTCGEIKVGDIVGHSAFYGKFKVVEVGRYSLEGIDNSVKITNVLRERIYKL